MNLTEEEKSVIVKHRLKRSNETLKEAKDLIRLSYWHGSVNRLYYACFYAVTALLTKHGHIAHTHGGVIRLLGQHFVITGIINEKQNKLYQKLFDLRQGGDYSDYVDVEESDVIHLLEPAENFIAEIEKLINNNNN